MRLIFLIGLGSGSAWAALTVSIADHQTNQDLVITVAGATAGDCALELSESPSYSPVVADVDNTKHPNSATCAGRPDTVSNPGGSMLVRLGHRVSDRSLLADTIYYLRVTSGADVVTSSFKTDTIGVGNTYPRPMPFSTVEWANRGVGVNEAVLANHSPVTDPMSGVRLSPIGSPIGMTGLQGPFSFQYWSGGTSWANAGTIINAGTSTASTTNTNPLDLFFGTESGTDIYTGTAWNDIGVMLYGCGLADSSHAADRTVTLGLFRNPQTGTVGTPFSVVLPTCPGGVPPSGSLGQVNSSSAIDTTDHAFPNSWPGAFAPGWGTVTLRVEDRPTSGNNLGAATGVLTLSGVNRNTHFSPAIEAGNSIAIASTACAVNPCVIASVKGGTSVTLSNTSITGLSGASFVGLRAGVRIQKTTATSTVYVGVKYKTAVYFNTITGAGNTSYIIYNQNTFTSGDGKTGRLATLNGGSFMYFLADDGTARLLWAGGRPYCGTWPGTDYFTTGASCGHAGLGWNPDDVPGQQSILQQCPIYPHGTLARDWILDCLNSQGSGLRGLYQIHYRGNASTSQDWAYTWDPNFGVVYPSNSEDNEFDWIRVSTSTNNIDTQLSSFSYYNKALYGGGSTFSLRGVSNTKAYFANVIGGGQDKSGFAAVVDITGGAFNLVNVISTFNGDGSQGKFRAASLHNVGSPGYPPDTMEMSGKWLSGLGNPGNYGIYAGPHEAQVIAVQRSGTWSADTSLPWPIDNTYNNTCPATAFSSLGATGNQCVHLKISYDHWCNTNPGTGFTESGTCSWNAAYTAPFPINVGDCFFDYSRSGGFPPNASPDDESFQVITAPVSDSGGFSFWAWRNSKFHYCCENDGSRPYCVESPNQATHQSTTGWIMAFNSQYLEGCGDHGMSYQGGTVSGATIIETPAGGAGHGTLVQGTISGYTANISGTIAQQAPYATLFDPTTPVINLSETVFAGAVTPVGSGVQSYLHSPGAVPWYVDSNHINDGTGHSPEDIVQGPSNTVTNTSCAGVYRVTPIGTVDYKHIPLRVVAGQYNLGEVSSPTIDLCSGSVPQYTFAYALRNGEAYSGTIGGTGSQAGEVYVKIPNVYAGGFCYSGQHWLNAVCVYAAWTGAGWYRQQKWTQNDTAGIRNRLLTASLETMGGTYAFSTFTGLGPSTGYSPSAWVNGWGATPWIARMPAFVDDSATVTRNVLMSKAVTLPSGHNFARLKFGRTPSFYCLAFDAAGAVTYTGRAEACVTDADATQPYKFLSETQTAQSCSGGCTVTMKVPPQTINYYQIEYSADGTTGWTADGTGLHITTPGTVTGDPCSTYSLAPTSHNYPAAGAVQAVTVTASDSSCAWTATYPGGWLSGSASGTGTQTFNVTAAVNAGTARSTTATIAGQSYAATQDAGVGGTGTPSTMISGGHLMTGGLSIR